MDYIGIDVHKKESQLCILSEGGELVEQRIRTTPERFADALGDRPRARILLEASTESLVEPPVFLAPGRGPDQLPVRSHTGSLYGRAPRR